MDGLINTLHSYVLDLALDIVLMHLNRSERSQHKMYEKGWNLRELSLHGFYPLQEVKGKIFY